MPNLNASNRHSVGFETTDATQSIAATFDTTPYDGDSAFSVWVKVLARQTNNANETGQYCRVAAFERHDGVLSQIGSTRTVSTDNESVGGWDVTIDKGDQTTIGDTTGDFIRVLVTGAGGDTVKWLIDAEIQVNDDAPFQADND